MISFMKQRSRVPLPDAVVKDFTNEVFKCVKDQIIKEGSFTQTGLGRFKVHELRARRGFNPYRREFSEYPATKYLSFRASPALKDELMAAANDENLDGDFDNDAEKY